MSLILSFDDLPIECLSNVLMNLKPNEIREYRFISRAWRDAGRRAMIDGRRSEQKDFMYDWLHRCVGLHVTDDDSQSSTYGLENPREIPDPDWHDMEREQNFLCKFGFKGSNPSKYQLSRMFYALMYHRFGKVVTSQTVTFFVLGMVSDELRFTKDVLERWSVYWLKEEFPEPAHLEEMILLEHIKFLPIDCIWFIVFEANYDDHIENWPVDWNDQNLQHFFDVFVV